MKTDRKLWARCLPFCLAFATGAAQGGSLVELYDLAKGNDLNLQAALHQRDQGTEADNQALAALLPQLAAEGGTRKEHLKVKAANTGSTFVPIDERYDATTYALTLSQTLFDWQAFKNMSAGNRLEAQAEAAYAAAEQDLILRVAQAYFNVLSAEDRLRADRDAQTAFRQRLDNAQERFKAGAAPVTDVKNAQAAFDSSTATVVVDTTRLSNARRALSVIVGQPVGQLDHLRDDIALVPPNPPQVDNWAQAAANNNPAVIVARLGADAAGDLASAAHGRFLPRVSAVGVLTAEDNEESQFGSDNRTDYVGINVEWRLFQGGRAVSSVREAKASQREAQARYQLALRTADQSVRDAYDGVVNGIASVRAATSAVSSQQNGVIATEVGFNVGIRTVIDVLNARQSLANSQKALSDARYSYLLNLLALKGAVGQLSAQDVQDIDNLLVRGAAQ